MRPTLALLALFFSAGCGGEDEASGLGPAPRHPVPGCEGHDFRPCDVHTRACQLRLMDIACCLRGEEQTEPPPITSMTEGEFADYLIAQLEEQAPIPEPNPFEGALVLLRLARAGDLSPATQVTQLAEAVFGFYRWDTKDIVLVDHGEASTVDVSNVVLVHELVHALQDRDVDLEAFHGEHATSSDAFAATDSLVEGEAELHGLRYAAAAFGYEPAEIDYRRLLQNRVEYLKQDLLPEPSPYTRGFGAFPYVWGARYAHFVWQEGGLDAIRARYAAPALTTRTLMASVDGAESDLPAGPAIAAPTPPSEWTQFTQASFGALGVYLLLTRGAGLVPDLEGEALAWRGDRLFVYQGPSADIAVVWHIDFADDATATLVANQIRGFAVLGVEQLGARLILSRSSLGTTLDWASAP